MEIDLAIFCDNNCPSCCNNCKHFRSDPLDDDDEGDALELVHDGYGGTCTLYEERASPLNECINFFCVAAAHNGTGYIGSAQSTDYCKGPFVLDEAFFEAQTKHGWCFTNEDVLRRWPASNSDSKSDE